VPIWFPTTKNRESLWITCIKMTCHILLESFWRGQQFCFRPHLNWRSTQKIMGLQSFVNLNFGNFWGLPIGSLGTKRRLGTTPMVITENTTRRKVVVSPSPGYGESCGSMYACGSSVHQKCSNYALINLLFGLCRLVWIVDLLVTHPNPHPKAPACLSYP